MTRVCVALPLCALCNAGKAPDTFTSSRPADRLTEEMKRKKIKIKQRRRRKKRQTRSMCGSLEKLYTIFTCAAAFFLLLYVQSNRDERLRVFLFMAMIERFFCTRKCIQYSFILNRQAESNNASFYLSQRNMSI